MSMFCCFKSEPTKSCIFVIGGPGSGKGTHCQKLVEVFGYVHLSAGDLLRAERDKGGPLGDLITSYIVEGKLVPASIPVRLLREAIQSSNNTNFMIDGFPRDMENMACWYEEKMFNVVKLDFVLFFDCPEDVLLSRLVARGLTSGRDDDNEETIKKRFQVFEKSTRPVIKYFQRLGRLRTVNTNAEVDTVFASVLSNFKGKTQFSEHLLAHDNV